MRKISMGIGLALALAIGMPEVAKASVANIINLGKVNANDIDDFKIGNKIKPAENIDSILNELGVSKNDASAQSLYQNLNGFLQTENSAPSVMIIQKLGKNGTIDQQTVSMREQVFTYFTGKSFNEMQNKYGCKQNSNTIMCMILNFISVGNDEQLYFQTTSPSITYKNEKGIKILNTKLVGKKDSIKSQSNLINLENSANEIIAGAQKQATVIGLKNGFQKVLGLIFEKGPEILCNAVDDIPYVGTVAKIACVGGNWVVQKAKDVAEWFAVKVLKIKWLDSNQLSYDEVAFKTYEKLPSQVNLSTANAISETKNLKLEFAINGGKPQKADLKDFNLNNNEKYIIILETN